MTKRAKTIRARAGPPPGPLVCVVDDDESIRESLPDLLRELGYSARAYASADEYLSSVDIAATDCLLLDVAMPVMTGPQLYAELQRRGLAIKTIFITAQADETVRRALVAQGAIECLFKPFSDQQLKAALDVALG